MSRRKRSYSLYADPAFESARASQSAAYKDGFKKGRAEGYRAGLEAAAKALPNLNRYEVGGECDGDSGHCYAEMELDDAGRYIGLDDAEAAIRALAKEGER